MSGACAYIPVHTLYKVNCGLSPGEHEFLDVWHESYAAIMRYARGSDGFWVIKTIKSVFLF
jgi:mannosidase alpha-like ER degradation enhancer 1